MVSSHANLHVGVLLFGGIEDLFTEPDEKEIRWAGVELINGEEEVSGGALLRPQW